LQTHAPILPETKGRNQPTERINEGRGIRNEEFLEKNLGAFFSAQSAAKNRALRCNSSARLSGLAGFPLQSLARLKGFP
jgi:hypothetical protein